MINFLIDMLSADAEIFFIHVFHCSQMSYTQSTHSIWTIYH